MTISVSSTHNDYSYGVAISALFVGAMLGTASGLPIDEVRLASRLQSRSVTAHQAIPPIKTVNVAPKAFSPKTELGRKLLAIRERIMESGTQLLPASELLRALEASRKA